MQNTPTGLSVLDVPTPPSLPGPPAWVHYTVESPWLLVVLLLLGAAVAVSVFQHRGMAGRGLKVGVPLVVLAAALGVAAHFVVTDREAIAASTRRLVGAVATADSAALEEELGEPCTLYYFQAPDGLGRAGILTAVTAAFSQGSAYAVSDWKLEALQTRATGERTGQAQVKVFVVPAQWNLPHHSWWRIDYVKDGDGRWRAGAVAPLAIQGVENARGR
ncbi:MAG: hypothetical protein U0637_11175 [Phycisphaerales bacterium]